MTNEDEIKNFMLVWYCYVTSYIADDQRGENCRPCYSSCGTTWNWKNCHCKRFPALFLFSLSLSICSCCCYFFLCVCLSLSLCVSFSFSVSSLPLSLSLSFLFSLSFLSSQSFFGSSYPSSVFISHIHQVSRSRWPRMFRSPCWRDLSFFLMTLARPSL